MLELLALLSCMLLSFFVLQNVQHWLYHYNANNDKIDNNGDNCSNNNYNDCFPNFPRFIPLPISPPKCLLLPLPFPSPSDGVGSGQRSKGLSKTETNKWVAGRRLINKCEEHTSCLGGGGRRGPRGGVDGGGGGGAEEVENNRDEEREMGKGGGGGGKWSMRSWR